MSLVPVEHIGRARALLRRLAAADADMKAALAQITAPIAERRRRGARVSYSMMGDLAAQWRDAMPPFGRLAQDVRRVPGGYDLTELRACAGRWEYAPWGDAATEEGVRVLRLALRLRREPADVDVQPVAAVGLHALARRMQRGRPTDDAAVLRDLPVLDCQPREAGERQFETEAGGVWVGAIAATCDPPLVLLPMVRTFIDRDCTFGNRVE